MQPKALIIAGFGINAEEELQEAFKRSGAIAKIEHISEVLANPKQILDYDILGFPGGFSFGDHLGSGKVFSSLIQKGILTELENFIQEGKLIIGICNGFQTLAKLGIVPNLAGVWQTEVSLLHNDHNTFINKWVRLKGNPASPCIWTKGIDEIDLPIRHGEGRFFAEPLVLENIKKNNLQALIYASENPNGSLENIAGISDKSGRVFALMPHPEAFLIPENHPQWMRRRIEQTGLLFFENAVNFVKGK